MNPNKICFIICSNQESELSEAMMYLDRLLIPENIEIEVIVINHAASLAGAYQLAMKQSDAKYKVYLHQDVYIIKAEFIAAFLQVFQMDASIGMIGVAGVKNMPPSGCWFDSTEQVGSMIGSSSGKLRSVRIGPTDMAFEVVDAIDGMIMITQYDLPWREDIFNGWHFYDSSACYEFQKAGYKVVVPRQETPWCIHRYSKGNPDGAYEHYRKIFVAEYMGSKCEKKC